MSDDKIVVNGGTGCFGCLTIIAFFIIVWALIFGVTVGGHHYGISCSTADGVRFD